MKGIYLIGANPRIAVIAHTEGEWVIADEYKEIYRRVAPWLPGYVAPGDKVDCLGACSFVCAGIDPRQEDGGPTFAPESYTPPSTLPLAACPAAEGKK